MSSHQEEAHPDGHDYVAGSPHLKHEHLFRMIERGILAAADRHGDGGAPVSVLEIGAGDGRFTESMLDHGCHVTATEMSYPSYRLLRERFRERGSFEALHDRDGDLSVLPQGKVFDVVLFTAVLHHVPDYQWLMCTTIDSYLRHGGTFLSFQDPLWYPTMNRGVHLFSRMSYFAWRLRRGNFRAGLATRMRRFRGVYDETLPEDMAEYHVVRSGVNETALIETLRERFEEVALLPYWSTQSTLFQKLGDGIGIKNTFGIRAGGYRKRVHNV